MPRGALEPGTYIARPLATDALEWQVMVPQGWTNPGDWYLYPISLGGPDGKDESGTPVGVAVAFLNDPQVFVDSCDFESLTDTGSVDDLVAAIQAKDDWVVSDPVGVTIGGFAGQRLDLALAADPSVCGPDNVYLAFGEPGTGTGSTGRARRSRCGSGFSTSEIGSCPRARVVPGLTGGHRRRSSGGHRVLGHHALTVHATPRTREPLTGAPASSRAVPGAPRRDSEHFGPSGGPISTGTAPRRRPNGGRAWIATSSWRRNAVTSRPSST
jgi:hypothetical protein